MKVDFISSFCTWFLLEILLLIVCKILHLSQTGSFCNSLEVKHVKYIVIHLLELLDDFVGLNVQKLNYYYISVGSVMIFCYEDSSFFFIQFIIVTSFFSKLSFNTIKNDQYVIDLSLKLSDFQAIVVTISSQICITHTLWSVNSLSILTVMHVAYTAI